MSIPLKLVAPSGLQHYDCTGCGECCRGRFAIIIADEDRERIVDQNWTDDELGLRGKPLFTPRSGGYQLAHRPDGACVFLQPDNKCRIHAQYGEAAKPLACRLYPFTFVPVGNQARVDVRFDCPATATNLGRPISEHAPDLAGLLKTAMPKPAAALPAPPLFDNIAMPWEGLRRITQAFEQVLLDVSLDITRRVTACLSMIEALRSPRTGTLSARALNDALDDLVSGAQETAVDDALERVEPGGAERLAFRQLLGLYGRIDQVGGPAHLGQRLNVSLRMLVGKGAVPPIRDGFHSVTFAQIEDMRGIPSGGAASALERYLYTHLASMGFFGSSFYGRSYLDGLSALLLTFPLTCWYARAFALAAGLDQPDTACVERALMIVDHQHGITPLLNIPSERNRAKLLCEHATLRSLVIWYGS